MKKIKTTTIVTDGKYNSFTSLLKWKDRYYLAYHASVTRISTGGRLVLLNSADGIHWQEILSPFDNESDYCSHHWGIWGERLVLFANSQTSPSCYAFSADGITWSKGVFSSYPEWIFWHPIEINNYLYASAYCISDHNRDNLGRIPRDNFEVRLFRTMDGENWEDIASISRNESGNETILYLDDKQVLHAYVRRELPPASLAEYRSCFPYTRWENPLDFGEIVQGQVIKKVNNRCFMIGRRLENSSLAGTTNYYDSEACIKIWVYEPFIDLWVPYLSLPDIGNCTYVDMEGLTDHSMLIPYCREANDLKSADIYLAEVRTDGGGEWGNLLGYGREILNKYIKEGKITDEQK